MINIICTSQAEHLVKLLKKDKKNFRIIKNGKNKDKKRYFPDGEIYARLEGIKNPEGRTIVIHSGMPRPNDGLMELKMVLEILKERSIKPEVFFTYFAYGMQDHADQAGALNTAENILKELTTYYAVQKIWTVDAHFWGRDFTNNYPIKNLSAVDLLKAEAQKTNPDMVFITPDVGSQRRTGISGVEKQRLNSFETQMKEESGQWLSSAVKDRNVGVVDDLLETGGTMAKFYDECKSREAKKVVALITHGVLPKGIKRIAEKYDGLYLTNTIKNKSANIDISGLINEVLRG
ncbi:MAG: ribose-phosphate pyrophosphokinase-like domain-containing protein [Patescibacteria group bacterium]|jgi:ribose-phosphate pyrophosphokinase